MDWGPTRPQPTEYTCVRDFGWPGQRDGFNVYEGYAEIKDNLWQDIFAWGAAGLGIAWPNSSYPTTGNNRINRATFFNNGLDNPCGAWPCVFGGIQTDALQVDLNHFTSITNSKIENIFIDWPNYPTGPRNMTSMNGEGARLSYRYIDGAITTQPLWPWPMEDQIKNELGYIRHPNDDPDHFRHHRSQPDIPINPVNVGSRLFDMSVESVPSTLIIMPRTDLRHPYFQIFTGNYHDNTYHQRS